MVNIRSEQLSQIGERAFVERFRALLNEEFEETRQLPREELDAAIQAQLNKAEQYGLTSEQAIATFIMSAWLLGPDFDEAFPAVKDRLKRDSISQIDKAKWLETFTVGLLDALDRAG